jgi:hypothetical protein
MSRKARLRAAIRAYRKGTYKKKVYPDTYVPSNPVIFSGQPM